MQRVVVDAATSAWIPIVSDVPQGSVLGLLLFILYTSEMFELVENRLYAYDANFTLLAVVPNRADRPAVAASLNRDLTKIQEWCNHWCMMRNPNKTKALVVGRSWTVNHPHGDLVFRHLRKSLPLHSIGVKFDTSSSSKTKCAWCCLSYFGEIGILRLVKLV